MPRTRENYDDIRTDIVEEYEKVGNIRLVADKFRVTQRTVSMILREEGAEIQRPQVGRPTSPEDDDTCYYCRAYSKTDPFSGWCMTHRRMTRGRNREACFK